jgi:ubiquinone biosynthesis monooxygenase Coq7
MSSPLQHLLDRSVVEIDSALRTIMGVSASTAGRPSPALRVAESSLSDAERDASARLMRVNHAGEVSAQALYRGQALFARDDALRERFLRSAREEHDHLAWCAERTRELGQKISILTPLWYAGALAIGAAAGVAGDRVSLSFLAETERQVGAHLDGHLERLPGMDRRSRAIVAEMRDDEMTHRREALERGATDLPWLAREAMHLASRVMTGVAHYL